MSPKAVAKARLYTGVAVLVSLIVVVAGYFLGFSSLWTAASEANTAADDQEARNDSEQVQVNKLKVQYEQIDDYRQLLEELRVQVPTTLEVQEFQRQLASITDDYDVTVNHIEFASSTKVEVTNLEAEALTIAAAPEAYGVPSPSDLAASLQGLSTNSHNSEDAEDSAISDAIDTLNQQKFSDFYVVPVTIELQGSYADTLRAIQGLQTNNKRIFAISGIEGTAQTEGGRSSDNSGEFVAVIQGQISVLLDPDAKLSYTQLEDVEVPDLPGTGFKVNPLTKN